MLVSGVLKEVSDSAILLEVGRKAVEDALIASRDCRLFMLRNNGFVIKEKNGSPSNVIRFGTEVGVQIALRAIAKYLEEKGA